jgi:hypothetical protein
MIPEVSVWLQWDETNGDEDVVRGLHFVELRKNLKNVVLWDVLAV